uniref:uncharacterized protein n=1 Tax=Semicossyphus pulcher TaxID=241346 RepID=UPI0037E89DCA
MSTADKLLEQMFSSIELRERCAEKLKKLAQELESHRGNCNVSECVGSSTAVFGAACLIGAGVATLFTGGAAAPLLGLAGGVCSGAGLGLSVGTKITEHFLSSGTLKEAQEIDRKNREIAKEIQKLFDQLEAESPCADPDDLEQYMLTEILKAMARRSGLQHQFMHKLDDQTQPGIHFYPSPGNMMQNPTSFKLDAKVILAGIVSLFSLKVVGEKMERLLIKGGQQLFKKLSKTGLKKVAKGGAMALGGAVVMVFELPEAIDNWKDLIQQNHVTEASKSMRDAADELQKSSRTLRKHLNDIKYEVFCIVSGGVGLLAKSVELVQLPP